MGRPKRATPGGRIYHVLNRANVRLPLFDSEGNFSAFETVLAEAVERTKTRLLCYCLMNNHWQLVVWPREDGELSRFVGWLTKASVELGLEITTRPRGRPLTKRNKGS